MDISNAQIEKAIHVSQHCQRNWDLSKGISPEDMDLLVTAATQCPSKQNIAFYRTHFITSRDVIEQIHQKADGAVFNYETGASTTNSQVLANLLVVFEELSIDEIASRDPERNLETKRISEGNLSDEEREYMEGILRRDKDMAVGIAAGYLNLTASLRGYHTGCCACFEVGSVKEILGLRGNPVLLMGIGVKNDNLGRRVHHVHHDFLFPTKQKQEIEVNHIN